MIEGLGARWPEAITRTRRAAGRTCASREGRSEASPGAHSSLADSSLRRSTSMHQRHPTHCGLRGAGRRHSQRRGPPRKGPTACEPGAGARGEGRRARARGEEERMGWGGRRAEGWRTRGGGGAGTRRGAKARVARRGGGSKEL